MAKENQHQRNGGRQRHGFQKPKHLGTTLRKLIHYLHPHRTKLVIVAICLVLTAGCTVAGSYLLKPIINKFILPGDFPGLFRILAQMAGLYLAAALLNYIAARVMVRVGQSTVERLRNDLFDKMQSLPLRYFDSHTHGELMSRYTNDIETVSEALNNSFASFISFILSFIGTLGMMLYLSPLLSLITFGTLAVMFIAVKVIGKQSRKYFALQQKYIGTVNGYTEEMISGQKVIKVFCHEQNAKDGFSLHNENYRVAATKAQAFAGALMPAIMNLSHINYAITCCIGGLLAIRSGDLGTLVAFLQYTRQIGQPVTQMAQQVNTILSAAAGAERIFDAMEQNPESDDGTVSLVMVKTAENGYLTESNTRTGQWAWKVPSADGYQLVPLKGDVRLHDVTFGYTDEKKVLRKISLFAKPGQKIAFVGSTGAGKTTITSLINRFYNVQEGSITYDGIDVQDIQLDSLRASLGMVLQDTHLFTGTILDNIRYGRPDASDEDVVEAACVAGADGFIRHLPEGYHTVLTNDGGGLSQGERQLLNIARTALYDPPVLILDEATSSIDTRTEQQIEAGMDRLMEGRTVFVIAHRLSTVRNAHAILVLEHGEIMERGSHDDLMAYNGRYHQLYTGLAELS